MSVLSEIVGKEKIFYLGFDYWIYCGNFARSWQSAKKFKLK